MDTRCALAVATAALAAAAGCTAGSEGTTAVTAVAPPMRVGSGMVVRAGPEPIDVSVPANWRGRTAVTWGNGRPSVSAIRFTPCPSPSGVWNAYAGGFLLGTRGACVPLVFQVGRERQVVRFGIRVRCEGEP